MDVHACMYELSWSTRWINQILLYFCNSLQIYPFLTRLIYPVQGGLQHREKDSRETKDKSRKAIMDWERRKDPKRSLWSSSGSNRMMIVFNLSRQWREFNFVNSLIFLFLPFQNIILIRDPEDARKFYPRFNLEDTSSFKDLDEHRWILWNAIHCIFTMTRSNKLVFTLHFLLQ